MNAYTTRGQAQIQQCDIDTLLRSHRFMTAAAIAALERQRGWQAEAEAHWLLKQHGVTPRAGASLVARLRQGVGKALVRAGQRLAGVPRDGDLSELVAAAGPLETGG